MLVRHLSAILALGFALTACGDSGSSTTADTTTADTLGGDTQADAVADDTGVADTTTADDTATATDTAVAEDTTPGDTAIAEDTTPADTTDPNAEAAKTCPGIIECFNANCVGLAIVQQQACVNTCMAAGDASEQQAVINLQTCVQTKNCVPGDGSDQALRDAFECQRQCLPQVAACFAGSFGTGGCADLSGCVENCDESDILCQRACYVAASEEQVQYYLDYNYCGLSQCYNSEDPIAQDTCLQLVIQEPACSTTYSQCFGSTGAGPGAGAGGGR